MTLKQFKDSLKVGDAVLLISTTIPLRPEVLEKQKKLRYISYKDTTGFYLKGTDDRGRGSFCKYPKASELTVNGDFFTIKDDFGTRIYKKYNN